MFLTLLLTTFLSAGAQAGTVAVKTELGPVGNKLVVNNFNSYKKEFESKGCKASGHGHRIMLTGFGLFSGVNYNISGAVVAAMSDKRFFPSQIDLESAPKESLKAPVYKNGQRVKIENRSLQIAGKNYEVCFITANVEWDFAAAVFIDQATNFKPELILMTGRGASEVSLEVGAINNAVRFSGFDTNGEPLDRKNIPSTNGERVLPLYPVNSTLKLTWNARAVEEAIEQRVSELGFPVMLQSAARIENNYICNNVSFVLAHASQNKKTALAGGLLVLESPEFLKRPKVGFFHFPATDMQFPNAKEYGAQIYNWGLVLAEAIASQF